MEHIINVSASKYNRLARGLEYVLIDRGAIGNVPVSERDWAVFAHPGVPLIRRRIVGVNANATTWGLALEQPAVKGHDITAEEMVVARHLLGMEDGHFFVGAAVGIKPGDIVCIAACMKDPLWCLCVGGGGQRASELRLIQFADENPKSGVRRITRRTFEKLKSGEKNSVQLSFDSSDCPNIGDVVRFAPIDAPESEVTEREIAAMYEASRFVRGEPIVQVVLEFVPVRSAAENDRDFWRSEVDRLRGILERKEDTIAALRTISKDNSDEVVRLREKLGTAVFTGGYVKVAKAAEGSRCQKAGAEWYIGWVSAYPFASYKRHSLLWNGCCPKPGERVMLATAGDGCVIRTISFVETVGPGFHLVEFVPAGSDGKTFAELPTKKPVGVTAMRACSGSIARDRGADWVIGPGKVAEHRFMVRHSVLWSGPEPRLGEKVVILISADTKEDAVREIHRIDKVYDDLYLVEFVATDHNGKTFVELEEAHDKEIEELVTEHATEMVGMAIDMVAMGLGDGEDDGDNDDGDGRTLHSGGHLVGGGDLEGGRVKFALITDQDGYILFSGLAIRA